MGGWRAWWGWGVLGVAGDGPGSINPEDGAGYSWVSAVAAGQRALSCRACREVDFTRFTKRR